jgi:hypothetical protein
MRIWTTLALLSAMLVGIGGYSAAQAYSSCTTTCYAGTCTRTCY